MSEVWYCPEIDAIFFVIELYAEILIGIPFSYDGSHLKTVTYEHYGAHLDFGPGYEPLLVFDDRWKKKSVYVGGV